MGNSFSDTISSDHSIKDALRKMKKEHKKYLIITKKNGVLYGVLCKDQLIDLYLDNVDTDTPLNKLNVKTEYKIIPKNGHVKLSDLQKYGMIIKENKNSFEIVTMEEYSATLVKKIETGLKNTLNVEKSIGGIEVLRLFGRAMTELELFRDTLESIPYSLFISDNEGKVVFINSNFEKSTGLGKEDVLGQDIGVIENMGVYAPAITPIIMQEKRELSIVQQLKKGIETVVTGIPIFNQKNELLWIVTISRETHVDNFLTNKNNLMKSNDLKNNKLVYKSKQMRDIVKLTKQVADANSTVLITGESGVGKDAIAKIIHEQSDRADKPFVQINCGAIPESLLESELFGYEAGAFSGASKKGKKGLIEAADTGTLFLDEIGDMPLNLQVKLLQVLQNKQIMRVGGTEQISVDVRIISATNQNLNYLVEKGKFRLDLYYRLNVIPINIPPLRNRKEDILPLTYLFLAKYTKKYNKDVTLTWDFEQALLRHPWPGNIRELDNLIERIVVLSKNGKIIGRDLLETIIRDPIKNSFNNNDVNQPVAINDIVPLKQALEHVEERLVKMAYNKTKSSYKMAKVLGISQSSAHRRIQKYISKRRSRN